MSYTTRTTITPSICTIRAEISSSYNGRQGVSSDLGYLETQLGFLCDNSGNTILFHTGTFYATNTNYSVRPII